MSQQCHQHRANPAACDVPLRRNNRRPTRSRQHPPCSNASIHRKSQACGRICHDRSAMGNTERTESGVYPVATRTEACATKSGAVRGSSQPRGNGRRSSNCRRAIWYFHWCRADAPRANHSGHGRAGLHFPDAKRGSALQARACSSVVEHGAHNPRVAGSIPAGLTQPAIVPAAHDRGVVRHRRQHRT